MGCNTQGQRCSPQEDTGRIDTHAQLFKLVVNWSLSKHELDPQCHTGLVNQTTTLTCSCCGTPAMPYQKLGRRASEQAYGLRTTTSASVPAEITSRLRSEDFKGW